MTAARLPGLASAIDLRLLRDQVCHRFQITHELATSAGEQRTGALRRAARILSADGENGAARVAAIQGHAFTIQNALERLWPRSRRPSDPLLKERLTASQRHCLERNVRGAVRQLRRHLVRSGHLGGLDAEAQVRGYCQLCYYYAGIGDLEAAVRAARRARRIRPDDMELRQLARAVRRLRRGR